MFEQIIESADYSGKTELEVIRSKRQFLLGVADKLKSDFVGLDEIIDSLISKIEAWYIMPESMRRPAIICMWGMTGVGKTDLIRRLVKYLRFSENYLEIQMTDKGSAGASYGGGTLQYKIEISNLEPNVPGVLFIDEMQRYRMKDESGESIPDILEQDLWQLLSDGKFASSVKRTQIYELLYKNYMDDWDIVASQEESEEDPEDAEFKKARALSKYKRGFLTAKRVKKLLKLDVNVEEIMSWDDEEYSATLREALKNDDLFDGDNYSKLLIIISGNIDEAYNMASNVSDGDVDANVLHEFSKNINFLDIKNALLKRFYPEQISRFGNNHIIYPSLSRDSYSKIIDSYLCRLAKDLKEKHNLSIEFADSVRDFAYRNGVFPAQGVRPVFSTMYANIDSLMPSIIISAIENSVSAVLIDYNDDEKVFNVIDTVTNNVIIKCQCVGAIDEIKEDTPEDLKMLYAVHEMGHSIIYSHEFGVTPTQIESNASSDGAFVGLHSILETKSSILKKTAVALAGHVAEKIVFGEASNGSFEDLIDATSMIKAMIKQYGMMDGLIAVIGNPAVGTNDVEFANNTNTGFDEITIINDYLHKIQAEVQDLLENKYNALLINLSSELFKKQHMSLERYQRICRKHGLKVDILPSEEMVVPKYEALFKQYSKKKI